MNANELQNILQRMFLNDPNAETYETGLCGEFAFALKQVLENHGVETAVLTCIRSETDLQREDPLPTFSFSHVVVEALGETWDYRGKGAVERWESLWDNLPEVECEFRWLRSRGPSAYRNDYGAAKFNLAECYLMVQRLEEALGRA